MAEPELIEAARKGDLPTLRRLLDAGANVTERDDHGWTALNWAAGRGDAAMVSILLDRAADVSLTGPDGRTPLMIAKAAQHAEVAALLTAAEQQRGVWKDPRESRLYCQAYRLKDLRRFAGWSEKPFAIAQDAETAQPPSDDSIVYLHQDFTVTKSMWPGEDVVFDAMTPSWRTFCEETLGFAIPAALVGPGAAPS